MKAKLYAAKTCLEHGVAVTIANGRNAGIIEDFFSGKKVGTRFIKKENHL